MSLVTKVVFACMVAILVSCSQDSSVPSVKTTSVPRNFEKVSLSSTELVFGDTKIAFPTTIQELIPILGEPRFEVYGFRCWYIWDDHGFTALTSTIYDSQVESFSVFVEEDFFFKGEHLHPRKGFSGQVFMPERLKSGETVAAGMECTFLKNRGFTESYYPFSAQPFLVAVIVHEPGPQKTRIGVQTDDYRVIVIAVEHDFDSELLPF